MAITDIQISEELETNAPSIKYRGDEGPKSPEEEIMMMADAMLQEEYEKYVYDLLEQRPDATPMSLEEFRRMVIAGYAKGGMVDYSKDPNYRGWKKTYETNEDAASMNENHSKYLEYYNRENKAYGGIMGMDGRRQYGIGSWFQENIMDPIKKNPVVSAAAAALAADQFGIPGTDIGGNKRTQGFLSGVLDKFKSSPSANETYRRVIGEDKDGSKIYETVTRKDTDKESFLEKIASNKTIQEGIARSIIPLAGGLTAGLFADKIDKPEEIGLDRGTGVGIQNVRKVANLLGQEEGMAAGLNFLPDLATRKFSPAEMAVAYGNAETQPIEKLAYGGRTGYANGDRVSAQELIRRMQQINVDMLQAEGNELVQLMRESLSIRDRLKKLKRKGVEVEEIEDEFKINFGSNFQERPEARSFIEGVEESAGVPIMKQPKKTSPQEDYIASLQEKVMGTSKPMMARTMMAKPDFKPAMRKASMERSELPMEMKEKLMEIIKPSGSMEEIFEGMQRRPRAEGGLMNLGGMEKDYREDGGFVPIGREEKADDVPARLSVNEFVFTADAVRGAGDGDVDEGAKRLQGIMKELEKRGQQGQDMIDVSERISEVMA